MYRDGSYAAMTKKHQNGNKFHSNIFFLPVHRLMVHEFETIFLSHVRKLFPNAAKLPLTGLPYWDELKDAEDPIRSPIFGNDGVGPLTNGPLQGPFAGFRQLDGDLVTRDPDSELTRPGAGKVLWVPNPTLMASALQKFDSLGDFTDVIDVSPHGQYHMLIGGTMGDVSIASADPVFWIHHAYIDKFFAAYQATSPQKQINLVPMASAQKKHGRSLKLDDKVPMYDYTYREALFYLENLCYSYDVNPYQSGASSAFATQSQASGEYGRNSRPSSVNQIPKPKPQSRFSVADVKARHVNEEADDEEDIVALGDRRGNNLSNVPNGEITNNTVTTAPNVSMEASSYSNATSVFSSPQSKAATNARPKSCQFSAIEIRMSKRKPFGKISLEQYKNAHKFFQKLRANQQEGCDVPNYTINDILAKKRLASSQLSGEEGIAKVANNTEVTGPVAVAGNANQEPEKLSQVASEPLATNDPSQAAVNSAVAANTNRTTMVVPEGNLDMSDSVNVSHDGSERSPTINHLGTNNAASQKRVWDSKGFNRSVDVSVWLVGILCWFTMVR
jgi:hypothetical protein